MSGFAIFNIDITNPEPYKEYIEKVKPIAEKFGGEYLVRGGTNQIVEGNWQYTRTVVIKFPSYKKAIERKDGKSTILVEYGDYYSEK